MKGRECGSVSLPQRSAYGIATLAMGVRTRSRYNHAWGGAPRVGQRFAHVRSNVIRQPHAVLVKPQRRHIVRLLHGTERAT
eukprot:3832840-Prymnesium_polylepis.2